MVRPSDRKCKSKISSFYAGFNTLYGVHKRAITSGISSILISHQMTFQPLHCLCNSFVYSDWLAGRKRTQQARNFIRLCCCRPAHSKCLNIHLNGPSVEFNSFFNRHRRHRYTPKLVPKTQNHQISSDRFPKSCCSNRR